MVDFAHFIDGNTSKAFILKADNKILVAKSDLTLTGTEKPYSIAPSSGLICKRIWFHSSKALV